MSRVESPRRLVHEADNRIAVWIRVRGVVQGVGFRPFVFRLACKLGVNGWVCNDSGGVVICAAGTAERLSRFQDLLRLEAPAPARIDGINSKPAALPGHDGFRILPSSRDRRSTGQGRVPPDRAACLECVRETLDPTDRRYRYPFTTCTECGPRYSILRRMPYDRANTTLASFPLCRRCDAEYEAHDCRRFHAQPIVCADCGPHVAFWNASGQPECTGESALRAAAEAIRAGCIIAIKGLGGFQLLVRADRPEAVRLLRRRKGRPAKPFAVMVASLEDARSLAHLGSTEERVLNSPENPIVLLSRRATYEAAIAPEVAPGMTIVGLFLPTTPLHHLLMRELRFPVVATSGNRSEEPIAADEQEALERLSGIADGFLVHDRPILRRVDDSVVRVVDNRSVVTRLARGYAPLPLPSLERLAIGRSFKRTRRVGVLATGGQQKAALALWNGTQAVLSPHVGDLEGPLTRDAFACLASEFTDLYGCELGLIACDLHPDYFTTRWAESTRLPIVRVQHHHAHAAACMVENDLLGAEVLALTLDGTGYGPDGTVWGGEALRATIGGYRRVASLRPFPLPGGEAAIRQPARVALSLLVETFGPDAVLSDADSLHRLGLSAQQAKVIIHMITRGINTPWTSSLGRLFDGIAALVLDTNQVSYEGEAAVHLEAAVDATATGAYPMPLVADRPEWRFPGERQLPRADWTPLVRAVSDDLRRGERIELIAAQFHQAVADWAAAVGSAHSALPVVLSGGCFQNASLLKRMRQTLEGAGNRVYCHAQIPPNDGGLAAGQLAVALATSFHENEGK
jgi:hydrogenase maturation protein HypF